ncbi:MAG TPA: hypothetical protein DCQ92_13430 [Verrucomicrobia subdivision 3 bacterium]|nr:hypothetical protein [Limisphaerales bacterium]
MALALISKVEKKRRMNGNAKRNILFKTLEIIATSLFMVGMPQQFLMAEMLRFQSWENRNNIWFIREV